MQFPIVCEELPLNLKILFLEISNPGSAERVKLLHFAYGQKNLSFTHVVLFILFDSNCFPQFTSLYSFCKSS